MFTALHREEKREEGDRGGQEDKHEREREVAQLCLTLCNPMDYSLPGSSVHGIFQAIVLEWISRRIKGGIKRRETDPTSNQFPKCSPPSRTHTEIHRVG